MTSLVCPLAEQLRPKTLADVIGQSHLLAPGKPLRLALEMHKAHSMILWGPPGVGKTTLAQLCAEQWQGQWIALSAVFSGVKEIRAAMDMAQKHRADQQHTILFIDEIHRFNKAQQDALLPYTESGMLTLIGATTENPSFEINNALLSRVQVYTLQSLTEAELQQLLQRACQVALNHWVLSEEVIATLVAHADGDARRLLNALERLYEVAQAQPTTALTPDFVLKQLGGSQRRFDKQGDAFYEQMSALHKSVRGSDPDAALYWLCRLLDGGMDPRYIARRLIRMAWEDIGLADPRAMQITHDAAGVYERLGSPEGELALGQAVIYLAVAAKSNAGYLAFNQAMAFVKQDRSRPVPKHLRNAPTAWLETQGYAKGYRYAHDEPHAYAAGEHYLPDGMAKPHWYQPVDRGLEKQIAEKMAFLKKLDEHKTTGSS